MADDLKIGKSIGKPIGKPLPSHPLFSPHSHTELQRPWHWLQGGLLVLPLSPLLGAIAFFGAITLTYRARWELMRRDRLLAAWAGLGIWMGAMACWGVDRGLAWLALMNFLPFFWAFGGLSYLISTPAQVRRLLSLIVVGSIPVGLVGLGQLFWGWRGPLHWGIIDWFLAAGGSPVGRLSSVFEYANVTAHYLTVVWAIGLGLLARGWVQGAERRSQFLLAGATGLAAIALGLTQSRNAWGLAAADGLVWAGAVGIWWLWGLAGAVGAVVLGAAFGPGGVAAALRKIVPRGIWGRLNDDLFPNRPVATLRSSQWAFAWEHAAERPVTGWGLNSFTDLYQQATGEWLGHPHNFWLKLAMESGWPVAIVLTGLVAIPVSQTAVGLVQSWRRGGGDHPRFDAWPGAIALVAFLNVAVFHLADVTFYDLRTNFIDWLLLACLYGPLRSLPK